MYHIKLKKSRIENRMCYMIVSMCKYVYLGSQKLEIREILYCGWGDR